MTSAPVEKPAWWLFDKLKDPTFSYNDPLHEYKFRGMRMWSPTGVVAQAWGPREGFKHNRWADSRYYKEEHRWRGDYVHRMSHYDDDNDLPDDIPDEFKGYLDAWREFKTVWKYKPVLLETSIYHPDYLYGVTPDCVCTIDGEPAIVEKKSGEILWWVAEQTAAQDLAVQAWDRYKRRRRRIPVQLMPTGKFKVPEEYNNPGDYDSFKAALKSCQRLGEPPIKISRVWEK